MKNFTFRGSAHRVKRFFNIHHLRQKSVYTVYIYKKKHQKMSSKRTHYIALNGLHWKKNF